jgi:SAM-dependent methyltransferase
LDLGNTPLANSLLDEDKLTQPERQYPLHVYLCEQCYLVQLSDDVPPEEIFRDYLYFSSYSDTWLAHVKDFTSLAIERFDISQDSLVVEIASNDGYLLQYFLQAGVPVLGIEPARNVAQVAQESGINTLTEFFNAGLARRLVDEGKVANLLVANNVLAHVPDLNDFIAGLKIVLHPQGVLSIEFPHLLNLLKQRQFDTIYHEHYSYFSLIAISAVLRKHGLEIFDCSELATHGGSLRIYVCHEEADRPVGSKVAEILAHEMDYGIREPETYLEFARQVANIRQELRDFLNSCKQQGQTVAAYGAAAKGNTLLNYCAVGSDLISFVADRSPHKQGKYLPGSHIPVCEPQRISTDRPDYVLILPWNLKDEIIDSMQDVRSWGGRFVIPVPQLEILP